MQKSNRDVQFVTGTSFIAAAGESLLRDINTGKTIRQVAFGPLTGIAHGGLPEKEVSFWPRWSIYPCANVSNILS